MELDIEFNEQQNPTLSANEVRVTQNPERTSRKFVLIISSDDFYTCFEVVHQFYYDGEAVQAIRSGIRTWLETADIPEKESGGKWGDNPCPMFTWSHYADYCQEIVIPGIVSVTWLNDYINLDEDFLAEN